MGRSGITLSMAWLGLSACAPVPFASSETDLYREPPPALSSDANAFWNDRKTGTYGELTVGAGAYRRGNAICRTARITSVNDAARSSADRTMLYCAGTDAVFRLDPTLSCRQSQTGPAVTCRSPDGDNIDLQPI